jgi:NADP-dependent 3-hydroxy acid dehydrogenase YdfG
VSNHDTRPVAVITGASSGIGAATARALTTTTATRWCCSHAVLSGCRN